MYMQVYERNQKGESNMSENTNQVEVKAVPITQAYIGKYVILRCYSAGVHVGYLKQHCMQTHHAELETTRRIWRWKSNDRYTLSEVAVMGLETGKLSVTLDRNVVAEVAEIIPCSSVAEDSLKNLISNWND